MFTLSVRPSVNTTTPSPDHLETSGFRQMIGVDVRMSQPLLDFRPPTKNFKFSKTVKKFKFSKTVKKFKFSKTVKIQIFDPDHP